MGDFERTAEQKAADDAINAAIRQVAKAYEIIPDDSLITTWMIMVCGTKFDEKGQKETMGTIFPDGGGSVSSRDILGMCDYAQIYWRDQVLHSEED